MPEIKWEYEIAGHLLRSDNHEGVAFYSGKTEDGRTKGKPVIRIFLKNGKNISIECINNKPWRDFVSFLHLTKKVCDGSDATCTCKYDR